MIGQATAQSQLYSDLGQLQTLKNQVKDGKDASPEALQKVAQQFESLFINQMLRTMREADQSWNKDGLFNSPEMNHFQDMLDQQLGVEIANAGGIGLSEFLTRQLSKGSNGSTDGPTIGQTLTSSRLADTRRQVDSSIDAFLARQERISSGQSSQSANSTLSDTAGVSASSTSSDGSEGFDSPEDFVATLYPAAEKAAATMGSDPRYLLAQAALESGWGKRMIRNEDGSNSYNLFGIKADSSWQGDKALTSTLEYRNGTPVRENAYFRSYNSYEESFSDYMSFLSQNRRYGQALQQTSDGDSYVQALQNAGYATDPQYASKISTIARGDRMSQAILQHSTLSL
ncbi:flagellar assembly peptidoglycan hydrolase FlgJ [Pokkaliibacter sp. CJK22405]|uniref:flagellar assembly peptidoglycan hydrolase FlgJ n=1 Tax=Pokkaliibacter sp. CJK22405 TaxID=3384615 RepID=UPI00398530B9